MCPGGAAYLPFHTIICQKNISEQSEVLSELFSLFGVIFCHAFKQKEALVAHQKILPTLYLKLELKLQKL